MDGVSLEGEVGVALPDKIVGVASIESVGTVVNSIDDETAGVGEVIVADLVDNRRSRRCLTSSREGSEFCKSL